jgi:tRNA 5-methylaminomethyl-2-thiouridine biosynthesis bifunctional protein
MQSKQIVDVVVIGAGLAGGATAHALIRRGVQVALLDTAPQIASKGSGNAWGLLTPYLSTKRSTLESLYSAGYAFTHTLLREHPRCAMSFHRTGALQLPSTRRLAATIESGEPVLGAPLVHRVGAAESSTISGTAITSAALHIPDAGFLSPRQFIEGLLAEDSNRLTRALGAECCSLKFDDTTWTVSCTDQRSFLCHSVVVCAAHETSRLELTSWLPLEAIRGQTTGVRSNDSSRALHTVVSYGGYITPDVAGMHFLGAHYSHDDDELTPRSSDTEEMLRLNTQWLPALSLSNAETAGTRVCFRTSTIDRLPYIGALPNYAHWKELAAQYRSGTNLANKVTSAPIPGIFVNVGHGSRGLLSCPISGEIIARAIVKEPLGELARVAQITTPERLPLRLHRASNLS